MKRILLLLCSMAFCMKVSAQNYGFEGAASTPPGSWTTVSGTWVTNTDANYVRTGSQSMGVSDAATSGTTIYNTAATANVPVAATYYLITIGWAKASTATNGTVYFGYRGTSTVLNPSSTSTPASANMDNVNFTRITSVSTATVAAGNYGPAMRAFRLSTATPTTIYVDDMIIYPSTVNQPDLTAPDPVTGLSLAANTLNWTNGSDVGAVQSGHDGVIVLRANTLCSITPVLNDQAMYHPSGGVQGVSSFTQNGITWTVLANLPAGTTSYNDASAVPGTDYTYAVINRDLAHNYSTAASFQTGPPPAMAYNTSIANQITGQVLPGASDAQVLQIVINTTGCVPPIVATSFSLSTNGTTTVTDIANAKLYYTGFSPSFSTTTLFGSVANPSGGFNISGGQVLNTGDNYFWLVYDVAPGAASCNLLDAEVNNITLTSGNVVPSVTAPPGSRSVLGSLSGAYTINPAALASCTNYTSFTDAVNAIQIAGLSGNVVFSVPADATFTEPPMTLSGQTAFSITFQKTGVGANPVVSGVNGAGTTDAVFTLQGSNNITFDGIDVMNDAGNGTTATQMEYGYKIINASATQGSSGNIIKNSKVTLNRTNTSSIGILQSAATTGGGVAATDMSGANHNNRYENVRVENAYFGMFLLGTAGFPDTSNIVTSSGGDTTIIGANTANDIGNGSTATQYGIRGDNQRNLEISGCIVRNITHTSTSTIQGIYLSNTSTTSTYGDAKIYGNLVYNIKRITSTSTTGTVHGIRVDVSATATATVYNNVVLGIEASNTTSASANQMARGITHCLSGTGNASYYNNSVSINTTATPNPTSVAFWKGGAGVATLNNNIFSNTTSGQSGAAKHFAIYLNAGSIASTSSNNLYWAPGTNGFVGFATADRTTLWQWIAAVSGTAPSDPTDAGSVNADPNFVSPGDVNFAGATPAALSGIPISGITTDILGNARGAKPTIGAIETAQAINDNTAPVITNVNITSSTTPVVSATITDNNATSGSVALWYRLAGGTTFSSLSPDVAPGSFNGTYTWNTSIQALPVGLYDFYIAARDNIGAGTNIGLSPAPAVSFAGFSAVDPPNFIANPDAAANVWQFARQGTLPGGTYTIGASGTYLKLTDAAYALNTNTVAGDITFVLLNDYDGTTGETFPIVFNQLTTSGGNWNVTIRPNTGVTGRVTSGDPGAGNALINLNGADRIVFDGRPLSGSSNEWIVRSTSTSGPAFRFINDAQNDTLRYMQIESGNTTAASGTIHISTGDASGNDNITITNSIIRDRSDAAGIPANAIYNAGTVGAESDNVVIDANEIFNFTSTGINITAGGAGDNWKMNNNSIYYNNATVPSTAQTGITFTGGNGTQIDNNFIGGSASSAGGAAWTNSGANAFIGILGNFGTGTLSTINNNTITNIAKTATGAATISGIRNTGGNTQIAGNTVGHATTANSITTSGTGVVIGIDCKNTTATSVVNNNTVANITCTSTGAGIMRGIGYDPSLTSPAVPPGITINNNQVHHLSTTGNNTGFAAGSITISGIYTFPSAEYPSTCEIKGNTIYEISNLYTGTNATVAAGLTLTNYRGDISYNTIYDIKNTSTAPATGRAAAVGLFARFMDPGFIYNNMISIGNGVGNEVQVNGVMITGGQGGTQSYFHNTIVLTNNVNTPALSSAFLRGENAAAAVNHPVVIQNNILYNNITSAGDHYAIRNFNTVPATNWTSNNNLLLSNGASGIGQWGTTNYNFADWQTNTSQDAQSKSKQVFFVNTATPDLHLTGSSIGDQDLAGTYLASYNIDFDGETRHNPPYMGLDEIVASPLPITLAGLNAKAINNDALLNWVSANESNSSHYEIEVSSNGRDFTYVDRVDAKGNSSISNSYKFTHINAREFVSEKGLIYYRLKMVDINQSFNYSKTVSVTFDKQSKATVSVYPNPVSDVFTVSVVSPSREEFSYTVTDMSGKLIAQKTGMVDGSATLQVDALKSLNGGIYFFSLIIGNETHQFKMIKK